MALVSEIKLCGILSRELYYAASSAFYTSYIIRLLSVGTYFHSMALMKETELRGILSGELFYTAFSASLYFSIIPLILICTSLSEHRSFL
jgi:hypothetical protein